MSEAAARWDGMRDYAIWFAKHYAITSDRCDRCRHPLFDKDGEPVTTIDAYAIDGIFEPQNLALVHHVCSEAKLTNSLWSGRLELDGRGDEYRGKAFPE